MQQFLETFPKKFFSNFWVDGFSAVSLKNCAVSVFKYGVGFVFAVDNATIKPLVSIKKFPPYFNLREFFNISFLKIELYVLLFFQTMNPSARSLSPRAD